MKNKLPYVNNLESVAISPNIPHRKTIVAVV